MNLCLPNACAVFKFINEYLQAAAGRNCLNRHFELADYGLRKLAVFASKAVT